MTHKPLILCAALALAACTTSTRSYNDLSLEEKMRFENCRAEFIANRPILENKTGTIGGAIDGALNAGNRLAELNEKAARSCARTMGVTPATVPGLRPE
jgi:hypothetical protein